MNTISPTPSAMNPWVGKSREFLTTRKSNAKEVFSEFLGKIKVCLEINGAQWEGQVEGINQVGAVITVEGYPMLGPSQMLQLRLTHKETYFEFLGVVSNIHKMETGDRWFWSGMSINLKWENLDNPRKYRLRKILKRLFRSDSVAYLHASIVNCDTGDMLLEIDSDGSNSVFDKAVLVNGGSAHSHIPRSSPEKRVHEVTAMKVVGSKNEIKSKEFSEIVSVPIELKNSRGQKIIGFHDTSNEAQSYRKPIVVITPGYGETKREYITMAYYLAANGFDVIRYDHTNHVGESEGDHVNTTIEAMKEDLGAVINFSRGMSGGNQIAIVATSLAGRAALKLAADGCQISKLILITGIVDVQATLKAVHQTDFIGEYLQGKERGITNVLGFNVDGRTFLKEAVTGGYADLTSTIEDARNIHIPITLFAAECDAWVNRQSVARVFEALPSTSKRWLIIPDGLHRLQENPRKARAVFRAIVQDCLDQVLPSCHRHLFLEPTRKLIGLQNRREREGSKARVSLESQDQQVGFWQNYLDHFHYITHSTDYCSSLEHICQVMGPLDREERILDAGCGNGNFGAFLHCKETWRQHSRSGNSRRSIRYIGADFVETALQNARMNLDRTQMNSRKKMTAEKVDPFHMVDASFLRIDLNCPLPFQDGYFTRVVSNLVIGYVNDPIFTIKELLRVLTLGGTLILTNLKPSSDLTQVYRNFVDQTRTQEEVEEARQVLNNSSLIRYCESDGLFKFFTKNEFKAVLEACGASDIQIYPTFASQAFLAVVQKRMTNQETNSMTIDECMKEIAA